MEQIAFGIDRDKSREDWQEAIEIIVRMWEEEYFEYESERFSFPRRMVTPKPFQDPHPPCWMAATSPGSSAVAGKLGLGLLSFSIMQPIERMAEHIAQYREAAKDPTPITRVTTNECAAYTLVHCVDDEQQLQENRLYDSVWWWYQHLAEFTLEWEFPHFTQEEKDRIFPLLSKHAAGKFDPHTFSDADMIVVGDPDTVLRKMRRYAELGVDRLLCYVQFGFLPPESVSHTIELLGKHVIPELEKEGIEVTVSDARDRPEVESAGAYGGVVD
jgi:alkanesulfonate monooxygenase SsuD/methylene tetrahydromethanopterin reductase-like flavin-dependent oxidoreductase (luciferase family)